MRKIEVNGVTYKAVTSNRVSHGYVDIHCIEPGTGMTVQVIGVPQSWWKGFSRGSIHTSGADIRKVS